MRPEPLQLKLVKIPPWQIRSVAPDYARFPRWVTALPCLKRDTVWKPGQVELRWDSSVRGSQIGSFVVSEELRHQKSWHGRLASRQDPWSEQRPETRNFLGAQQRSNAAALGFFDPFLRGLDPKSAKNRAAERSARPALGTKGIARAYGENPRCGDGIGEAPRKTRALKKGMMQELLSGRTRVA